MVSLIVVSVRRALPSAVLLDAGVLVVHMQAGGDALGDHPGTKHSGCAARSAAHQAAVEGQGDLVGAADVEVIADDLLEKHRPATGLSSI